MSRFQTRLQQESGLRLDLNRISFIVEVNYCVLADPTERWFVGQNTTNQTQRTGKSIESPSRRVAKEISVETSA